MSEQPVIDRTPAEASDETERGFFAKPTKYHAIWGALGIAMTAGMWWAWSLPGAGVMFACIGLAFWLWYKMTPTGAWVAVAVVGVTMSGILGWQAITGARCPADGTKVFLKVDKPPVGCDEIRASAGSMSAFFGIIAFLAIGTPIYLRRLPDDEPEDDDFVASTTV